MSALPGWVGRVLAWAALLAAVAVLLAGVAVPRLAGAATYTVLTGSMEPSLPPGTLVVVRPVPPEDVAVGAVVTYQLRSGEPTVATHRVVQQGVNASTGERVFRTQGDANEDPDVAWVRAVQVRGQVWYAVPHVGRVTQLVGQRPRGGLLAGLAAGLLLYAAYMFTTAARDRFAPGAGPRRGPHAR